MNSQTRQSRRVKFSRAFVTRVVQGTEHPGPWTDTESPLRLKGTRGGASYSVMRKVGGNVKVFTPRDTKGKAVKNSAGVLTLDQARTWAKEVVANLTLGKAPQSKKNTAAETFDTLADDYLRQYQATHAATSTRGEQWGAKYASTVLGSMEPADIDAQSVAKLKRACAESPANLRKAWGVAKRIMDLAVMRGLIPVNIFAALPAPKAPPSKVRYPRLHELAAIWKACAQSRGVGADIVQFCIAMPLRPDTVASLTWGEVNLSAGELHLLQGAGRKFKGTQRLPLPSLGVGLLAARQGEVDPGALVFGSDSQQNLGGKYSGWSGTVKRLSKRSGVGGWSTHDFRRSVVSIVAELRPDISETALDRWLTHAASSTNTGVKAVYQRAQGFTKMRRAADAWDSILRKALDGKDISDEEAA